jgi:hypothetical protein
VLLPPPQPGLLAASGGLNRRSWCAGTRDARLAWRRLTLAVLLLLTVIGMPMLRLAHEAQHHHQHAHTVMLAVEASATMTAPAAGDDEANCPLCHLLVAVQDQATPPLAGAAGLPQAVQALAVPAASTRTWLAPPTAPQARGPPAIRPT